MLIHRASRYNVGTSLTHSSTIPATLRYRSPTLEQPRQIAEFSAYSEIWDLVRWAARKPTREEIHWLAGLFEGEGSFGRKGLQIPQKDREILDRVRRLFGGRVVGPYQAKRGIVRPVPMFRWEAYGPRARSIAVVIFHLLSTRRQAQARDFLRISRGQGPPRPDPADPAASLWDWGAPDPWDVE